MPYTRYARAFRSGRGILLGCALSLLTNATFAAGISAREAQLFEALINHGLGDSPGLVVIGAQTTGDPAAIAEHAETANAVAADLGAPAGTLDDWIRRNSEVVDVSRPLQLDASYQLMNDKQRETLFGSDDPQIGWDQFFERYPGTAGLIRLSRAGFDDALEHALLYVEHQCGVECGAGRLVLLKLASGQWAVQNAAIVWMVE